VVDRLAWIENDLADPLGFEQRNLLQIQKELTIAQMRVDFPNYQFSDNFSTFVMKTQPLRPDYANLPIYTLAY